MNTQKLNPNSGNLIYERFTDAERAVEPIAESTPTAWGHIHKHCIAVGSALFTGDIEADLDRRIAARITTPVDLLKSPHHGSATAASRGLLAAVDPRVSIISVGLRNSYGHPAAAALERLAERSGAVARTDLDGTVIALINPAQPDRIEIRTGTTTSFAPARSEIGRITPGGSRAGTAADAQVPAAAFIRLLRTGSAGCPLPAATIGAWQSQRTLRYSSPGAMTSS